MAFFSDEFIDEVKSANDIVDVISGYVNLRRHGTTFFGNCPFHKEKTGSFAVQPEKQIFHCFGCGVGGNVVSFIMKSENMTFPEAIEFLADRAKIELPKDDNISKEAEDKLRITEYHKNQMYEINKEAGRFFYQNIYKSDIAKNYINKRKLNIETVKKFGIGFAMSDNGLVKHLQEKGFKEKDLLATGLIGKSEKGFLYDKFKDRLMFPIFDIKGRVVAFGGRALGSHEELKEKKIPKYVNSPENLIYTKGKHLYGLNIAKKNMQDTKTILVVEGYMDVVSPHSYGVTNVVASLGTALTEAQGKLLRNYAEEVVLSYDSDEAGQKAILRGIDVLSNLGISCKVLQMQDAKDPDEYILKFGKERFLKLVSNSITAVEYKIKVLMSRYNLNDTSDKIKFLTGMAKILASLANNIERDIYIEKFSKELGVSKEAIVKEVEKFLFKNGKEEKKFVLQRDNNQKLIELTSKEEETILYLLTSKNKEVYNKIKGIVDVNDFTGEVAKPLLVSFYNAYDNESIFNLDDLTSLCNNENETNLLTKILLKPNTSDDFEKITQEVLSSFKLQKNQAKRENLINLISSTQDEELRNKYTIELNDLIKELSNRN
ncbi:MAG: DNA primase [Clostridia bacterium]|nr:DNA primase [Clostridia bacterium]